jgi:hypothetical protein
MAGSAALSIALEEAAGMWQPRCSAPVWRGRVFFTGDSVVRLFTVLEIASILVGMHCHPAFAPVAPSCGRENI